MKPIMLSFQFQVEFIQFYPELESGGATTVGRHINVLFAARIPARTVFEMLPPALHGEKLHAERIQDVGATRTEWPSVNPNGSCLP